MRGRVFLGALAWLLAAPAYAQSISLPCGGSVQTPNASSAFGTNGWLQFSVSTIVPVNLCVAGVSVEAWVVGVAGSTTRKNGVWSASVQRQVPVPSSGQWITNGAHFYVCCTPSMGGLTRYLASYSQSTATVVIEQAQAEDCSLRNGGGDYYVWDPYERQCVVFYGSPIIVDATRGGYRLTGLQGGVPFDLDGDGQVEQVSWTHHRSGNAFLALDRNGNGTIDNGTELFGAHTPVGVSGTTAENGFEALRFFEGFPFDHQISAGDPVFERLLLWTDRNHDGLSEPEELQRLADAGVAAIGLNYKTTRRTDRFGNEFRQVAKLTWTDGRVENVYDVWLKRR